MPRHNAAGIPMHDNITLQCIVCPNKPTFSDLSHLLTHLQSKAHLHKKNVLELNASDDTAAAAILDNYTRWMRDNNLTKRCKERQDRKDTSQRGYGARATNASRRAANSTTSRNRPRSSQAAGRQPQALRENTIDPQLDAHIKIEDEPTSDPYAYNPAIAGPHYAPPMSGYGTTPYPVPSTMQEPSVFDSIDTDSSSNSPYVEAAPRRSARGNKHTRSITEVDDDDDYELYQGIRVPKTHAEPRKKHDFPGCNVMDCATQEGKRMRNQKKDDSAIVLLENVSKSISPREIVSIGGVPCRDREITGFPNSDDGQPVLPGEGPSTPPSSPPKKKQRAYATRAAPTKRKAATQLGGWAAALAVNSNTQQAPSAPAFPYVNLNDVNDGMTFGGPSSRRQGGIRVHHDNSGPAITFGNTRLPVLTSGLQQQPSMQPRLFMQGQQEFNYTSSYSHDMFAPQLLSTDGGNPLGLTTPNFGSFGFLNNFSVPAVLGGSNPLSYGGTSQPAVFGTPQQAAGTVPSSRPPTINSFGPGMTANNGNTQAAPAYDPLDGMMMPTFDLPTAAFPPVDQNLILGSNDDGSGAADSEGTVSPPSSSS
ncbi:uncharacterized protein LTR77_002282 [Saxophila tyrrhenica]|uniref:C2H2-type domain-containing protein n=1 Tax=Saxophila tyrrhenica TaxID=1690608 RepID=A0AAV9PJW3_9PEZI|nr:hypothetical protein LTR77_002282 [Saxophila tyrrhenica]